LPIIFFFFFFLKTRRKELWVILFYCVYSFINDKVLLNISQTFFLSLFTFIELTVFSFFYWTITQNPKIKLGILATYITNSLFLSVYYILGNNSAFDSIPVSSESIIIFIYSILLFYTELSKPQVLFIYNTSEFWIILGILIYLSGSFFIFSFADKINAEDIETFWSLTFIFNTLKNLFFSVAFTIKDNRKNEILNLNSI